VLITNDVGGDRRFVRRLLTLQHWIANNLFGLAFSLNGVEFLQLNRISTGCILLGGLFVYDIFWVSCWLDS